MRRPSPALVVALLALFVALDGPAAAQRAVASISGAKLRNGSVTGAKIRNGTIGRQDLSATARRQLSTPRNGSVTRPKLAPNAVTPPAIATGGVNTSELAQGAVSTEKLANGSVAGVKLADDAVSSGKVADGSLAARDVASAFGQATVNFKSIAPGACVLESFNPPGDVKVDDDVVAVSAPSNFPDDVSVTARLGPGDSSFTIVACNGSGAPVDPSESNIRYLVFNQ